jgi:Fe-S cluster biogenesis protein NfuA
MNEGHNGVDDVGGVTLLTDEERAERLAELDSLVDLMRPAVQADGGDLVLTGADAESGVIEVTLQGSCSSCAISATTLQAGVERIVRDRLPWVTEVHGAVDEATDFEASMAMGRGAYVPRMPDMDE